MITAPWLNVAEQGSIQNRKLTRLAMPSLILRINVEYRQTLSRYGHSHETQAQNNRRLDHFQ